MKGILRALLTPFRVARNVALGLLSAVLVGRIVGSILWLVCTLPAARRLTVWRFARRLRKSGVDSSAAEELIDGYAEGLRLFGRGRSDEPYERA